MKVVFVVIDTLRPDHLGCYGYPRPTSPRLDALAEQSVLFERAYPSDVPTQPSYTAMFTGQRGIRTGVAMMPILPFIEDNEENIEAIVRLTHEHGGKYIIPWFGMSLRDRQRAHYYKALDELFPGLRAKYEASFGSRYGCPANNADRLRQVFEEQCASLGVATHFQPYQPDEATQPRLL